MPSDDGGADRCGDPPRADGKVPANDAGKLVQSFGPPVASKADDGGTARRSIRERVVELDPARQPLTFGRDPLAGCEVEDIGRAIVIRGDYGWPIFLHGTHRILC